MSAATLPERRVADAVVRREQDVVVDGAVAPNGTARAARGKLKPRIVADGEVVRVELPGVDQSPVEICAESDLRAVSVARRDDFDAAAVFGGAENCFFNGGSSGKCSEIQRDAAGERQGSALADGETAGSDGDRSRRACERRRLGDRDGAGNDFVADGDDRVRRVERHGIAGEKRGRFAAPVLGRRVPRPGLAAVPRERIVFHGQRLPVGGKRSARADDDVVQQEGPIRLRPGDRAFAREKRVDAAFAPRHGVEQESRSRVDGDRRAGAHGDAVRETDPHAVPADGQRAAGNADRSRARQRAGNRRRSRRERRRSRAVDDERLQRRRFPGERRRAVDGQRRAFIGGNVSGKRQRGARLVTERVIRPEKHVGGKRSRGAAPGGVVRSGTGQFEPRVLAERQPRRIEVAAVDDRAGKVLGESESAVVRRVGVGDADGLRVGVVPHERHGGSDGDHSRVIRGIGNRQRGCTVVVGARLDVAASGKIRDGQVFAVLETDARSRGNDRRRAVQRHGGVDAQRGVVQLGNTVSAEIRKSEHDVVIRRKRAACALPVRHPKLRAAEVKRSRGRDVRRSRGLDAPAPAAEPDVPFARNRAERVLRILSGRQQKRARAVAQRDVDAAVLPRIRKAVSRVLGSPEARSFRQFPMPERERRRRRRTRRSSRRREEARTRKGKRPRKRASNGVSWLMEKRG